VASIASCGSASWHRSLIDVVVLDLRRCPNGVGMAVNRTEEATTDTMNVTRSDGRTGGADPWIAALTGRIEAALPTWCW
jgi:hypothetical protein